MYFAVGKAYNDLNLIPQTSLRRWFLRSDGVICTSSCYPVAQLFRASRNPILLATARQNGIYNLRTPEKFTKLGLCAESALSRDSFINQPNCSCRFMRNAC